jgi:DNA-binding NarL/FixJ family response regulator
MARYLFVDDHSLVRQTLAQALRQMPGVSEVAEAGDADTAIKCLSASRPFNLILVDLILPGMSGLSLIRLIQTKCPGIPILVLSSVTDRDQIEMALAAGGTRFFCKSGSFTEFQAAVVECLATRNVTGKRPRHQASPATNTDGYVLTRAQRTVLGLLCQGFSNGKIAGHLGISEGTVKIHVHNILKALGVSSRHEAIIIAGRMDMDLYRPAAVMPASDERGGGGGGGS